MKERVKILLISSLISFSLLLAFSIMQFFEFKVLKLDIKWIVVSGLPILIGLFLSGVIKRFKGFVLNWKQTYLKKLELV